MRISTSQIYDQSLTSILNQQSKLANTQNQISTGKRILNPSDDPSGSVQILNLQRELSLSNQYIDNAVIAGNKLEREEVALDSVTNLIQRVRELAVQGLNDSNSQSDRQAIATEMRELNEQLLSVANTKDANGDYLFSGFATSNQPYDNLLSSYQGDEGQRNLKVGEGVLIATNDPANRLFEAPVTQTSVTPTLVTSDAAVSIDNDPSLLPPFTALTFDFSAGPPEEYTVTDGTNTETFPYTDGGVVDLQALNASFPALDLVFTGAPADGDQFVIEKQTTQTTITPALVTSSASVSITGDSGVLDPFTALTFDFSAGPPEEYTVTDGTNTATFAYSDGEAVDLSALDPNFPSLEVTLSGNPADGDQFAIEKQPGNSQTVFQTINNFAAALEANNVSAGASPNNGDFLTNIDAVLSNILDGR
uniref:flagellar hook-associated protein FlgL n=1 Tax=Methylophaga sp. TaxID=2024840 RepID=UPI003F69CAC0